MAEKAKETERPSEEAGASVQAPRQVLVGTVVSDKMDKTITVAVERTIMHRLYQRYVKRTKRFAAHDEKNECRVGDRVLIESSRPLSKRKRWRLREIVERAK
jgi:small subunit ribosomal protein S17